MTLYASLNNVSLIVMVSYPDDVEAAVQHKVDEFNRDCALAIEEPQILAGIKPFKFAAVPELAAFAKSLDMDEVREAFYRRSKRLGGGFRDNFVTLPIGCDYYLRRLKLSVTLRQKI